MEYACYCNIIVTGGGSVPADFQDPNDALCSDLYKCYKCINIDYDHEGKPIRLRHFSNFQVPMLLK